MSTTVETTPYFPPGTAAKQSRAPMRAVGRAVGSILMSVLGMAVGFTVMGKLLHRDATRPSTPSTWATVALDSNSSVTLPPGATHQQTVMPVGTGNLVVDEWSVKSGSFDYTVARTPIAAGAVASNGAAILRGAANGAFASLHIDAPDLTATKIADQSGLIGVGLTRGETVQGAFVYSHGALYEMLVAGPNAVPNDLNAVTAGFSTHS